MASPWQIANTTVRNPYRLKEGLKALAISPLLGNLVGTEQEAAFTELLHEDGVVSVQRIERGEDSDYSDAGRKWRSALDKMGFITPKLKRGKLDERGLDPQLTPLVTAIPVLTGTPYEITPQGRRLISAKTVLEEQEYFLRTLVARQIDPFEPLLDKPASILHLVLKVIASLDKRAVEPTISFEEMASIVQFVTSEDDVTEAVDVIIDYRERRRGAKNKKEFDREFRQKHTRLSKPAALRTLTDYADMNLRYLRASGLFSQKGRGIGLAERRRPLIEQLLANPYIPKSREEYFSALWNGAELPTDHELEAHQAIKAIADALHSKGEVVNLPELMSLPIQDLAQLRFSLEKRLGLIQEEEFAQRQRAEWEDILEYMNDLQRSKTRRERVPASEDPAYLEWSVWRAFLAIDSLVNKSSEARRFQVDQDFLPVRTAPGNGPDMFFEFDDFVLVVEVTLSGGSRQEAMEGEPVRRHVAKVAEEYEAAGKQVYGLFIAIDVDTNTAETFRVGTWYRSDDSRLTLSIVPMRLEQFSSLFKFGFTRGAIAPSDIRVVLDRCLAQRTAEAPDWKKLIAAEVARTCEHLS